MMRAVLRGVLILAFVAVALHAQTLDEAVRNLAKKVAMRLTPADVPRVTARTSSNLGDSIAAKARAIFERSIRRPAPRSPEPLDVTLTLARNPRGYLLVADFTKNGERVVEMVEYHPNVTVPAQRATLERQLLWEQDTPMLDVTVSGDRMFVLEPFALIVYQKQGSEWQRIETRPSDSPVLRDARGRLELDGDLVRAFRPGTDASFTISGEAVKFTPARNTIEVTGRPPFFSYAQAGGLELIAETDGRIHAYDSEHRAAGVFEKLGSDIVAIGGGCAMVLASSPGDRDSGSDTLTAFDIVDRKPAAASDPAQFSGPITALWPMGTGAIAIARNPGTGRYAAYRITARCSN